MKPQMIRFAFTGYAPFAGGDDSRTVGSPCSVDIEVLVKQPQRRGWGRWDVTDGFMAWDFPVVIDDAD